MTTLRIAITPGEPAGIGPDLLIQLAQQLTNTPQHVELVIIADPQLLTQRAAQIKLPATIRIFDPDLPPQNAKKSELCVWPIELQDSCTAGALNKDNAHYVLATLDRAIEGCATGLFDAMVTAPVQKSIINDAGITFSGHTEYLAEKTQTEQVVMMLAADDLRVALVTTHLPLSQVPENITAAQIDKIVRILHRDLQLSFGLQSPRICVLGLNPHAGEGGHMGREEIDHIIPAVEKLKTEGFILDGPLPADTAFTEKHLKNCDAVLAMYHDQGLPVLKYKGFGNAVNVTLGLPIVRTSVDHGTALDMAGTGKANTGSLQTAIDTAVTMAKHRKSSR